jgi:hypothetical protein
LSECDADRGGDARREHPGRKDEHMRAKGIAYDTGFIYKGSVSRERFDPGVVRRELAIIRDDLHCKPEAAFTAVADCYRS